MAFNVNEIKNEFIQAHLQYTDRTEPPKLFHVWAAIGSLSACMGRHLWTDMGLGPLYGNMYVLLVGPPSTKKSTAIKLASSIMRDNSEVKFAPTNTGGKYQGLITAITDSDKGQLDNEKNDDAIASFAQTLDIQSIANIKIPQVNVEDRHTMFANASEFGSFIGQNSTDLTRFLIHMWDGDDFDYQLKSSRVSLHNPLLSILGGTTPTDISTLLPPEAIGQGFMSRCILVYAGKKAKSVPPSKVKLDTTCIEKLADTYNNVSRKLKGKMSITSEANDLFDRLYDEDHKIPDTRFVYYVERRAVHLMKLAMVMAASELRMQIEPRDVFIANNILTATEHYMPDALGEYGLSPVSVAKQKMVEYLQHARQPISITFLWQLMQKDMTLLDFRSSISALVNANKIAEVKTEAGECLMYKDKAAQFLSNLSTDEINSLLMKSKVE